MDLNILVLEGRLAADPEHMTAADISPMGRSLERFIVAIPPVSPETIRQVAGGRQPARRRSAAGTSGWPPTRSREATRSASGR